MPSSTIHDISIQVQHAVTKTLWRRSPLTNDLLQALALLCLYPTSGHKEGFMDGWLLSGISINHALTSFGFLNQPPSKSLLSDEMLSQLRLWNTFCLTHLQYVPPPITSLSLMTFQFYPWLRTHCQCAAPVSGPLLSHLGSPPSNSRGWKSRSRDPPLQNHPQAPKQPPATSLLRNRVRGDRTLENGMVPSPQYATTPKSHNQTPNN